MRHHVCKLATREAIAFRSAAMLNIYAVKTGSEFVTTSDLKISGFDRPRDSKFFAYSKVFTVESRTDAVSHSGFARYVCTEGQSAKKKLRIQKYPETTTLWS